MGKYGKSMGKIWEMGFSVNGHAGQEPIEDGGTDSIYVWPMFEAYVRIYPQKIWPYMVQYLHFRILEFPLIQGPLKICWTA